MVLGRAGILIQHEVSNNGSEVVILEIFKSYGDLKFLWPYFGFFLSKLSE